MKYGKEGKNLFEGYVRLYNGIGKKVANQNRKCRGGNAFKQRVEHGRAPH